MKTASLAALLFFVASTLPLTAEVRIWKDASGQHEVKAELIGVAAGVVSLKTADGRTVKLQFGQLSKEDQAFLRASVTPASGASASAGSGGNWPQWRGPNRDDSSTETGLLKEWPADGPKRLWVNEDAGLGYSGFAIVDGVLYTLGLSGDDEKLIAIDTATGKKLWDTNVGGRLRNQWGDGPRSTPTVAGGLVFALGGNGDLVCADAKTGKKKWDKSLTKDLGGVIQNWGYTESPLVEGELVIVTPGGSKGTIAALSVKNGSVKWQTKDYTENAQYSSAIAIEHGGKRQIVQLVMNSFVGVSADDGKQLWKAEFPGRTAVIPTPIHKDGFVYVAAGYGVGCKMIKLGEGTPETVYENKTMVNHHGGVILVGDYLYGHSDGGGWVCQDFKTGAEKWSERSKLRKGCVAYADWMLYCVGEDDGTVVLIEASPEGWKEHGRFKLEKQSSQRAAQGRIWTHPVICGGRLYLRDQEFISCYDVKKS
jgi:outer membrane protein assembly factor BamB